ncbi:MAG: hypothetical protein IPM29_23110 [Planctomycetes bacterium]|nr:hypothetical protein [Planctomycetota bacterium]
MNRILASCVVSCAVPLLLLPSGCHIAGGAAQVAFMSSAVDGTAAVDTEAGGANLGDRQNRLDDDLRVGGPVGAPLLSGWVATDIGRFGLSTFWFDESGNGTLSQPYGDLPAGTPVNTSLEVWNLKPYWVYDVVDTDILRLAPGVAVDITSVSTDVRGANGGRESTDILAPIPMPFVDGELKLGPARLGAQLGGMYARINDGGGLYWDFETRLGVQIEKRVDLFLGFRHISLNVDGTADGRLADSDFDLNGWFVGGGVVF